MNSYTLTFENQQFETLYRIKIHKKEYDLFFKNLIFMLIAAILGFINSLILGNYFSSIGIFSTSILLFGIYKKSINSYNLMDYFLFFQSIGVNAYFLYMNIIQRDLGTESNSMAYHYQGMSQVYFQIGLFIGTRYYLKALSFLLNLISQIIFLYVEDSNYFSQIKLVFIFCSLLCWIFIYGNEKQKRELFLTQHQNSQWIKSLEQSLNISIMQCVYDEQQRQIKIFNNNKKAQQKLEVQDPDKFKVLIRNTFLKIKNYSFQDIGKQDEQDYLFFFQNKYEKMLTKRLTLEKLLYFIFVEPKKCQKLFQLNQLDSIFNQQFEFCGFYKHQYLKITCFAFYDQTPQIVLLIQDQLDLEKDLSNQYYAHHNQMIATRMLKENQNYQYIIGLFKKYILDINQFQCVIPRTILTSLYLHYNTFLNLNYYLRENKCKINISQFNLNQLLKQIQFILKPYINKKQVNLKIKNYLKPQQQQITSCYSILTQILLNLLINSIRNSKKYNTVTLLCIQVSDNESNTNLIKFVLTDQAPKFMQKQLDKLPVINAINLEDIMRCTALHKLKLGMIVSNYLIQQIGWSKTINVNYYDYEKSISFKILKDLSQVPCRNDVKKGLRFELSVREKQHI